MAELSQKPAPEIVWAGRIATTISDPVSRLRFLQAVVDLPGQPKKGRGRKIGIFGLLLLVSIPGLAVLVRPGARPEVRAASPLRRETADRQPAPGTRASRQTSATVWLVENSSESEVYSNGLRVDNRYTVSNHPRGYRAFPLAGAGGAVRRQDPAGIVFHISESADAPFEPSRNRVLKKIGESLLDYVRRQRAYNFVIDRFGRVYRVVREGDAAFHAGHSIWADERWIYLNLNDSFLGVAFEGRSQADGRKPAITAAQVRAAADLTEMLRAKFAIPAGNCVTHAQVSVNPSNRRVGYHTDWKDGFPFEQVGLPDNYSQPLPSVALFGFVCDQVFLEDAAPRLRKEAGAVAQEVASKAASAGLSVESYRGRLQRDYRAKLAALDTRATGPP